MKRTLFIVFALLLAGCAGYSEYGRTLPVDCHALDYNPSVYECANIGDGSSSEGQANE